MNRRIKREVLNEIVDFIDSNPKAEFGVISEAIGDEDLLNIYKRKLDCKGCTESICKYKEKKKHICQYKRRPSLIFMDKVTIKLIALKTVYNDTCADLYVEIKSMINRIRGSIIK